MSESPVIGHYINGQSNNGDGERYSDVFNPAIGTVQARVALASVKTVDEAVASAKAAFAGWADQSSLRRARVMFK
ncbi:aldehyde dehydrogenase family protein, partial [Pseudomonas syringae]